jgi:hypothetical protein
VDYNILAEHYLAIAYIEGVPKQTQANDWQTSEQIKKVVEIFLVHRKAALPSRKRSHKQSDRENQESQDEYGFLDLDLDDPVLLQALGEDIPTDDKKVLDQSIAQVMDKVLIPYFYARVCKQVEEDLDKFASNPYQSLDFDFGWIDCWVKCAQVVVANAVKANNGQCLGNLLIVIARVGNLLYTYALRRGLGLPTAAGGDE